MQDLIVLGIIPGTDIQIGFLGWLTIAATILLARVVIRRERQSSALRFLELRISLVLVNRRIKKSQKLA